MKIIKQVGNDLEWMPRTHQPNSYIATTNPGFFSGSWGEQITILFNGTTILINSICNPEDRASLVSFGRNRRNVETLIAALQQG